MKQVLITGAFSALAALAGAGWMRQPAPQAPQPVLPPAYQTSYSDPAYANPGAYPGSPYAANPALYSPGQRYYSAPQRYDGPARVVGSRAVRTQRIAYSPAPARVVRTGRPFSHSAAIVAGGAGAGAAIGALAGGGRGAGIGALSGGLAGLIYDRLTHNKTSGF